MIKRMNKATSLLLAAAAVVSIVPAVGVSAAEKLETKEGTIEQAVAFEGGKYIYEGYKTDADETGVYYNDGNADKLEEDLNADSMTKFGNKYAAVEESDEYLVDLSTGKVSDETTEDITDNVKSKLKSALSKTDRYGKVSSTSSSSMTLNQISQDQFGATWYEYTTTGAAATYSGYVNDAGKYIDTDYTANIYVLNAAGTKIVKISNFGEKNTDYNITVNKTSATTIAQDNDYIYRLVNVDVVYADTATTSQATYIQKISKAQGVEEDDAYLPNTVASYEVSSVYDSENADDAAATITAGGDFRVINGVLYVTKNNDDNTEVTVTTIKLKKDKATKDGAATKLDLYLAEQDVQESQDIAGANAVSIDVDGNTWAVNDGKIYKFDGTDFNSVYTCDTGIDTLDVYNADSLIAWQDGKDIYTTVDKEATETPVDNTTVTPVVNKGWVKTDAGWTFYNNGSQLKGQWVNDGGVWYMIKADGIMATGWYNDNGTWYYLAGSGAMKTGWLNDNGTWYYLQSSGAMKTGWLNDNGTWYYLSGSGAMLANTVVDGYKLSASGAWVK
jgi:glucan-binding YG repeat protein